MCRNIAIMLLILVLLTLGGQVSAQSDEARRHFDRGMAAVEMAKTPEDLEIAIKEFKQATVLAPAWAEAFFNLGKVQETAGNYRDSIASLQEYLRLAPNAADAEAVKSLINKLEFKAESVVTAAKAVTVLGQLSSWRAIGDGSSGVNRFFRPKGPTSIEVPSSVLWYAGRSEPDVFLWELKVNGPKVSFQYTNVLLDKKNVANYTTEYEIELEVVSPTKVKVKAIGVWRYWALGGDTVTRTHTYELVPPSDQ